MSYTTAQQALIDDIKELDRKLREVSHHDRDPSYDSVEALALHKQRDVKYKALIKLLT